MSVCKFGLFCWNFNIAINIDHVGNSAHGAVTGCQLSPRVTLECLDTVERMVVSTAASWHGLVSSARFQRIPRHSETIRPGRAPARLHQRNLIGQWFPLHPSLTGRVPHAVSRFPDGQLFQTVLKQSSSLEALFLRAASHMFQKFNIFQNLAAHPLINSSKVFIN